MHRLEHELVVQAPADNVYQLWRNFENLPNFMSNIEEVVETGDGRSHWKARGPLGRHAEWDAEITRDEPARAIAWRSVDAEDNDVRTHGVVDFESLGDATRVHVVMEYEAPAGPIGDWLTQVFANPEAKVRDDMHRFKETIESNEGYRRATRRIAGVNTSEDERVEKERYPADAFSPGEAGLPVRGGSTASRPEAHESHSQSKGRYAPGHEYSGEAPVGPGMPEETSIRSETAHETPRRDDARGEGFPPDAARTDTRATSPGAAGRPANDQLLDGTGEPEGTARNDRPITTSTPGGTLGAPTESDLLRDQSSSSERQDTRYETDQR